MMLWKPGKLQSHKNRRTLFDVELYFAVHKSFASTSLNTIHRSCTFHLSYSYWTITSMIDRAQININSDKNIIHNLVLRAFDLTPARSQLKGPGDEVA
jgi:hypothetical protein